VRDTTTGSPLFRSANLRGTSIGHRSVPATRLYFNPGVTLGATGRRPRVHDHGRQLPIRLDALRRADWREVRMEQGSDPGHFHSVRLVRDVAGTRRGGAGR